MTDNPNAYRVPRPASWVKTSDNPKVDYFNMVCEEVHRVAEHKGIDTRASFKKRLEWCGQSLREEYRRAKQDARA